MSDAAPFSNREIVELFKAADERADNFHNNLTTRMEKFELDVRNSLQRIENQTTLTNGRVNGLENWRSFITGGMAIISLIVLPMFAWALYTIVNIKGLVNDSVHSALQAYDIIPGK
jgi:hypothetical protein